MANKIWRNFLNKPKLSQYISNTAEVGFCQYGPTFGIAGTLTANNGVVLVHNLCAEITFTGDRAYHFFNWFAFRPSRESWGTFNEIDLKMPSKFTISPEKAHEYSILFSDTGRYSEMKTLMNAIKDAWQEAVVNASRENQTISYENLFSQFMKLQLASDARERIKEMSYWHPGLYTMRGRVTTENPKQIFNIERTFELNEEEAKNLGENATAIISDICQQPKTSYFYATPVLTEKS